MCGFPIPGNLSILLQNQKAPRSGRFVFYGDFQFVSFG